jgi:hypothetical protein
MWKAILKIDMDEARRLGRKYAPKDMERHDKEKAKKEKEFQTERHKKIVERIKSDMKFTTIYDEDDLMVMEDLLEKMEDSIGSDRFMAYLNGFKSFAAKYDL